MSSVQVVWVNTGLKHYGHWPALIYSSWETASRINYKLPSAGDSTKLIKRTSNDNNSSNVSREYTLIQLLQLNIWFTLKSGSNRLLHFHHLDLDQSFELNSENTSIDPKELSRAYSLALRVLSAGIWEFVKEENLMHEDMVDCSEGEDVFTDEEVDSVLTLSDEATWTSKLNTLKMSSKIQDARPTVSYPLKVSRQDMQSDLKPLNETNVNWIPAFLRLYSLVQTTRSTSRDIQYDPSPLSDLSKSMDSGAHNNEILIGGDNLVLGRDKSTNYGIVSSKQLVKATVRVAARRFIFKDNDTEKQGALNNSTNLKHVLSFLKESNYEKALEVLESSLIWCDQQSEAAELIGDILYNIGIVHFRAGNFELEICEDSLLTRNEALGSNHFKVASSLVQVGLAHFYNEAFEKALNSFQIALRIRRQNFGNNSSSVYKALNNQGCTQFMLKRYREALDTFQQALDIQRILLLKTDEADEILVDVCYTLSNIGHVYFEQNQHKYARDAFKQVLEIQQAVYGSEYTSVQITNKILLCIAKHLDNI